MNLCMYDEKIPQHNYIQKFFLQKEVCPLILCLTLELQIADYVFVTAMAIELTVKILAEGLIFTPNALLQNMSGVFDVLIFSVNLVWLAWTPHQVSVICCCYIVIPLNVN